MKYIKLVLLVALALTLVGCGDDDYNGGGDSGGGNYGTYWGVLDTITGGDVANMTQKPESPGVMVLVLLILYYSWNRVAYRPALTADSISSQTCSQGTPFLVSNPSLLHCRYRLR